MTSNQEHLNRRIRETVSNLSDEELSEMLHAAANNYTAFALKVARDELAKREQFKLILQRTEQGAIKQMERSDSTATLAAPQEGEPGSVEEDSTGGNSSRCYIEVWQEKNFEGEYMYIEGPGEYPVLCTADIDWGNSISSIRVGPNAFVHMYSFRDFKGAMITLGPNEEVSDLGLLKFDNEIDSIKVIDSIKIFNRSSGEGEKRKSNRSSGESEKRKSNRRKRH